jgi:hypothetical protein
VLVLIQYMNDIDKGSQYGTFFFFKSARFASLYKSNLNTILQTDYNIRCLRISYEMFFSFEGSPVRSWQLYSHRIRVIQLFFSDSSLLVVVVQKKNRVCHEVSG